MADQPGYTIAGGTRDAARLAEQARIMAAASMGFLRGAGAGQGAACLDVGCGGGQVALALAEAVGPGGRVVGADVDDGALDIARAAAAADPAGGRVTFVHADATALGMRDEFDLASARLVLSHLVEPAAAVRAMAAAVCPGGAVAVEDMFLGTLRADPPAPALHDLQEIYGATVRAGGGDPTIGPRLPAMLTAAGLVEVVQGTVENRVDTPEGKRFLVQLLDNMREAILHAGAATRDELDGVRAAVARVADDPGAVVHQVRMHQVSGRRPAPSRRRRR